MSNTLTKRGTEPDRAVDVGIGKARGTWQEPPLA